MRVGGAGAAATTATSSSNTTTNNSPVNRVGSRRVSTARDPSVLVQVQVEYWRQAAGRWAEGAIVKAKKDEAFLELPGEEETVRFRLDHSLRVEHSTPLSRDFHLVLSGSPGGRWRVAVYGEGEGQDLIRVLRAQGAQVIRRRVLPPCLPPPRPPPKSAKGLLRPISEGQVLQVVGSGQEEEDDMTLIRRKSTGSSDPDIQRVRKSADLPRSSSTGIKDPAANSPPWFKLGPEEEESRGLSTGSTRKKRQQRSDQSLNSDEVSSGSFHQDHDDDDEGREVLRGSDSSLATASSDEGVFGINVLKRSSSKRDDGDDEEDDVDIAKDEADRKRLERYKFLLVNIEEDPSLLDPSGLDGEFRRCDFDDYPDLTLPEGDVPDAAAKSSGTSLSEQVPRWIRKSFEELDLDVSVTEHRKRSRESPQSRDQRQRQHRYLRQTSSLSATSSEASASASLSRLESPVSPQSPPQSPRPPPQSPRPPPLPPRPPLLKQTSKSSTTSSSSSKRSKKQKRPLMLFQDEEDRREAEEV